jgi:DNA polymerase I-like protein with 3'-5' exonuclease and polymerase domains
MFKARAAVLEYTGLSEITGHKLSTWLDLKLPPSLKAMWPKTPSGKYSTASDTWERFEDIDLVKPIVEYNKYEKLLSTYGTKLLTFKIPPRDRIHPKYNIAGARTGRLSSSGPNIQNQPRDSEFRSLYRPALGYKYICADFSQIEVRVAAEVSRDTNMLDIYRRGDDIYLHTASRILGKNVSNVTKQERQYAKAILLGSQFGLGAKKFSEYARVNYGLTDVTEEKALELINGYREAYPEFRQWQLDQTSECEVSLRATTYMGKTRALDPDKYYGMALNHPIQGTAAEIILLALCNFYKNKEKDSLLIACVHDEILVEVPEEKAESSKAILVNSMVDAYKTIMKSEVITNLVSVNIGDNWGDAK